MKQQSGAILPDMNAGKQENEWLDYREAAELMHRPPAYLRERNADGSYKYWPEIERWQPGGRRTRLYVRREHIEAWIEASRTPAPSPIKRQFSGLTYEGAVPGLLRIKGGEAVIRALGLDK